MTTIAPGVTRKGAPPPLVLAAVLGFVGFVTSFGAHIVAVNLPVYAATVGVGVAVIGLLIAAYDFAEIVAKPVFGWIADSQGMKRTMLAGIAVFTAASLSYLIVPPQLLIAVRFSQGVGAAALSAVSLALVGRYFEERKGRAYGIYNAIKGAGYVVSPAVGGLIVLRSSFSMIFVAAAAVGVVAFLIAAWLPGDGGRAGGGLDDDHDDLSLASLIGVFGDRHLLRWFAIEMVTMFFVGILFGFLPVRVHDLHYGPVASGALLSLVALSYLLIQPLAGWVADRAGAATTVRAGLLLSAASTVLLGLMTGPAFVAASIAAGIGIGVVWTNTDTLISGLADPTRLGATMGAAGSFKELGDMLGPLIIGLLAQAFGLPAGFVLCAVLGLAALGLIRRERTSPAIGDEKISSV